MSVKIKIHRGTNQIGGTITEIYTEKTHVWIDFGSELSVAPENSTDGKMVDLLQRSPCDAVLFTHYHGDHVGLLEYIPEKNVQGKTIRLGMGAIARQVMLNIHQYLRDDTSASDSQRQRHGHICNILENRDWISYASEKSFQINPEEDDFRVTPIRVGHSAVDAYMFLLEVQGVRIVHTGDFRTHGLRDQDFFSNLEKILNGRRIDVLLTEGTMMSRQDKKVLTEMELREEATELLSKPENKYVFLVCSSTNVESLASFHNAVIDSNKRNPLKINRAMYVNAYVEKQMLFYKEAVPEYMSKNSKFYKLDASGRPNYHLSQRCGKPTSQNQYREEEGFLCLIAAREGYRKYIEPFMNKNPLLIYSMWDGYLDEKHPAYKPEDRKLCDAFGKRKIILHTSGHAAREELQRMISIVNPQEGIIPVHTEKKEEFLKLCPNRQVKLLEDGEEYIVPEPQARE